MLTVIGEEAVDGGRVALREFAECPGERLDYQIVTIRQEQAADGEGARRVASAALGGSSGGTVLTSAARRQAIRMAGPAADGGVADAAGAPGGAGDETCERVHVAPGCDTFAELFNFLQRDRADGGGVVEDKLIGDEARNTRCDEMVCEREERGTIERGGVAEILLRSARRRSVRRNGSEMTD